MFAYVTVKKNTHSPENDTHCSKNVKNSSISKSTLPCFPYYYPGYYLKKNYFGVGIIKGKGLFKGGIIF